MRPVFGSLSLEPLCKPGVGAGPSDHLRHVEDFGTAVTSGQGLRDFAVIDMPGRWAAYQQFSSQFFTPFHGLILRGQLFLPPKLLYFGRFQLHATL